MSSDPDDSPDSDDPEAEAVPSLTPADLDARLRERDPLAVLDVRDRDEFEEWRVSGPAIDAVQVPHVKFVAAEAKGTVADVAVDAGLDPDDGPALVVCGRGEASAHVAGMLRDAGYDAHNLEGGMDAWARHYDATEVETTADATVLQYRRPSSGCLAYLVVSGGEAVVIDPLRAFADRYAADAEARGATLVAAVDTHVHADHLSGVRAVAASRSEVDGGSDAGAAAESDVDVVVPAGAADRGLDFDDAFDVRSVADGDDLRVGDATLTALATPGHTSEMTSFRLGDLLFTGDTLFVESVARPDLERGDDGADDLAHTLYRTLHDVVLELPDDTRIAPGHYGETTVPAEDGSYTARLGDLRADLRALSLDEEAFVEHVVGDLPPRPASYERIIETNLGRASVDDDEAFELELGPNNCAVSPVSR